MNKIIRYGLHDREIVMAMFLNYDDAKAYLKVLTKRDPKHDYELIPTPGSEFRHIFVERKVA